MRPVCRRLPTTQGGHAVRSPALCLRPVAGDDIHRRRGYQNGPRGDLARILQRRPSFTLARIGRKSHHVTPEQPYNPHS